MLISEAPQGSHMPSNQVRSMEQLLLSKAPRRADKILRVLRVQIYRVLPGTHSQDRPPSEFWLPLRLVLKLGSILPFA